MTAIKKNRNTYFDFLRGIAIIMVVGCHTVNTEYLNYENFNGFVTVFFRCFINCCVPIFLAISGYFIAKKNITSYGKDHFNFLLIQIPKIYIPCLVFSLPYLYWSLSHSLHNIIPKLLYFFSCGYSVYYFIALIVQYYLLLPLLKKFNNINGFVITALISLISVILVDYVLFIKDYSLPLIAVLGPFPVWMVFFFMGVFFSGRSRNYSLSRPITIAVIGLVLEFVVFGYLKNMTDKIGMAIGINPATVLFNIGIILILFSRKLEMAFTSNFITKIIVWLGGISFGIYLSHCFVIIIVSRVLPNLSWISQWSIVVCLTAIIVLCTKSLFPKFSDKVLGFR